MTRPTAYDRTRAEHGRAATVSLLTILLACGDPLISRVESGSTRLGPLRVHTAYALPPFSGAPMPIYLTIDHTGSAADSLLTASSPITSNVMLHGGGMEGMHALALPAGGSLVLKPGGTHLMLQPPLPRLARGDSVSVTLRFAQAGEATIWVMVIDYDDLDQLRGP